MSVNVNFVEILDESNLLIPNTSELTSSQHPQCGTSTLACDLHHF